MEFPTRTRHHHPRTLGDFATTWPVSLCHARNRSPASCRNCQLWFAGKRQSLFQAWLIFSHDYLSEEKSCISPLFVSHMAFSSLIWVPVRMFLTLHLGYRIFSAFRDCVVFPSAWSKSSLLRISVNTVYARRDNIQSPTTNSFIVILEYGSL